MSHPGFRPGDASNPESSWRFVKTLDNDVLRRALGDPSYRQRILQQRQQTLLSTPSETEFDAALRSENRRRSLANALAGRPKDEVLDAIEDASRREMLRIELVIRGNVASLDDAELLEALDEEAKRRDVLWLCDSNGGERAFRRNTANAANWLGLSLEDLWDEFRAKTAIKIMEGSRIPGRRCPPGAYDPRRSTLPRFVHVHSMMEPYNVSRARTRTRRLLQRLMRLEEGRHDGIDAPRTDDVFTKLMMSFSPQSSLDRDAREMRELGDLIREAMALLSSEAREAILPPRQDLAKARDRLALMAKFEKYEEYHESDNLNWRIIYLHHFTGEKLKDVAATVGLKFDATCKRNQRINDEVHARFEHLCGLFGVLAPTASRRKTPDQ
jgi:hypothetical protein